eukprot:534524_1
MTKVNRQQKVKCTGFIVKDIVGKGKGMIATQYIKQGEQIYSEQSLMAIDRNYSLLEQIETQFNNLSESNKQIFLNLAYQSNGSKQDIFRTNAISNTIDNKSLSQLFPTICRVNHDCFANSHWKWNRIDNKQQLIAAFDIKCGEEITANYLGMNTMLTYNIRSQLLFNNWGFKCNCVYCFNHENRALLDSLILKRQHLISKTQKMSEESYNCCIELIQLTNKHFNYHPLYLFEHHFQAFKCCVRSEMHSLQKKNRFHKIETLKYFKRFMGGNAVLPHYVKHWMDLEKLNK